MWGGVTIFHLLIILLYLFIALFSFCELHDKKETTDEKFTTKLTLIWLLENQEQLPSDLLD